MIQVSSSARCQITKRISSGSFGKKWNLRSEEVLFLYFFDVVLSGEVVLKLYLSDGILSDWEVSGA
jgi:hypothetical protein